MHLLIPKADGTNNNQSAVDLAQTPAPIVALSAADTDIAILSHAQRQLKSADSNFPDLRLANIAQLAHPLSVDLYLEQTCAKAQIILLRLLGGVQYWQYLVDELTRLPSKANTHKIILLPGDNVFDKELQARSNVASDVWQQFFDYFAAGGLENSIETLKFASQHIGFNIQSKPPRAFKQVGLYLDGQIIDHLDDIDCPYSKPVFISFYRALLQSGDMATIERIIALLRQNKMDPIPFFCHSLKDPANLAIANAVIEKFKPRAAIATTGFALSNASQPTMPEPWSNIKGPTFQFVMAGSDKQYWQNNNRALLPKDLAMHVALPEIDGRVLARAVSFKQSAKRDLLTQTQITTAKPSLERVKWSVQLIKNWIKLQDTPVQKRRIALVLAHYPTKQSRIGNGVGLDTPASITAFIKAMQDHGYHIPDFHFTKGDQLIKALSKAPNAGKPKATNVHNAIDLDSYLAFFATLPKQLQQAVTTRWKAPSDDPMFRGPKRWDTNFATCMNVGGFALPGISFGNICIALQPARGYQIDPISSYHDPDLVPPHNYLAFYAWVRQQFKAHGVIQFGKHGNLEWLPGKALCLSTHCWPEAILGPMPLIYPFIVNDPGEGTQAKRRNNAVIIDHLMPPLMRAELDSVMVKLEHLVDEYFDASNLDPRRQQTIANAILDLAAKRGLDQDCNFQPKDDPLERLAKLDRFLCDIKETQIRGGLHIFGQTATGTKLAETLVALTRLPRSDAKGPNKGIITALAEDLGIDIDATSKNTNGDNQNQANDSAYLNLTDSNLGDTHDIQNTPLDVAQPWRGAKPAILRDIDTQPWRTLADTIERLEKLALNIMLQKENPIGPASTSVVGYIDNDLLPRFLASAQAETQSLLHALDGHHINPGPSGAPSRARHDVFPTGRNFFSLDTRALPTPAAWRLGFKSAEMLIQEYAQTHGNWPRHVAISAWGTANMRTGGDDIAQAFALMGVRPTWDAAGGRVTGYEILPTELLDRPRVDVTLRISGFFRDAFPALIDLFDTAVRAVATLDEPVEMNPIAASYQTESAMLAKTGIALEKAQDIAASRIFGSRPGSYGAGLQAPMDEGQWQHERELAQAYISWSGYRYSAHSDGEAAHTHFKTRLGQIQAIIHNQDNREHDILDSDDYYQFEGGLSTAVYAIAGKRATMYHNDHSNPERPRIQTLDHEIARTLHARVTNPKWIAAIMDHGYKGGFEMAAAVDYLFAFKATTGLVKDHHFDKILERFIMDDQVRDFLCKHNRPALSDIAKKLLEALARNYWQPRLRNDVQEILKKWSQST